MTMRIGNETLFRFHQDADETETNRTLLDIFGPFGFGTIWFNTTDPQTIIVLGRSHCLMARFTLRNVEACEPAIVHAKPGCAACRGS